MSASRQTPARSRVFEWQTVTVASALTSRSATRASDDDAPADHHRPAPGDGHAGAPEQLHAAERRPRHHPGRRAGGEPAEVEGMEPVGVLGGRDRLEHGGGVDLAGQRELDQHAVDVGVLADPRAEVEDLRRGAVAARGVQGEADAGSLGGPPLVADVGGAGRVVPAEHHGEVRRRLPRLDHGRDLGRDLGTDRLGDRAPVDDGGGHEPGPLHGDAEAVDRHRRAVAAWPREPAPTAPAAPRAAPRRAAPRPSRPGGSCSPRPPAGTSPPGRA